jgi:dihydroorotase-like cyclic amidohydrolase
VERYVDHLDTLIGWGEERSYIDFNFHPVIGLEGHLEQIPELVRRGVTSFKHYHYVYDDPRGRALGIYPCDDAMLYRSFEAIAQAGPPALAMVHAEDGPIINYLIQQVRASGRSDLEAWTLARPSLVENIRIRRVLEVARHLRTPVYLVHVTTKEAIAMIRDARQAGEQVWAETQTCFLTHTAESESEIGAWGKINPALKYEADRQALWRGIRSDALTCLGDDHLDYGLADKQPGGVDRFNNIWGCNAGMPGGMEHLLPVMITAGVRTGLITMEDVVRVCATNTAKAMGLYPRKGIVAPGADADVVIVDPSTSKRVDERFYHTHVKDWSLYWGWLLYGIPSTTIVRGRVVLENGETAAGPGRARFAPGRAPA